MLNISKYHKLIVGCSAIATAAVSGFVPSAEAAGQLNNQTAQSNSSTTLIAGVVYNGSNHTGVSPSTYNGSNNGGGNNSNAGGPGIIVRGPFGNYYFDSNNGGVAPKGNGPFYYDPKGPKGPGYYPYQPGKGQQYFYGNGPKGLGYYSYNVNATNPVVSVPPGIIVKGPDGKYYFDSNNGGVVTNGGYYYDANGPKGPGYYPYTGKGNAPYYFGNGPKGLGYYSYNVNATNPVVSTPPGTYVKGSNGEYYFDSNNGGVVANGGYYYDANGPKGPGYYPFTGNGPAPYYFGNGPQGLGYYSYNVNGVNGSDGGAVGSAPSSPGNIGGIGPNGTGPNGPNGTGPGSNGTGPRGSGFSSRDIAFAGSALSRFNAAVSKYEIASAALAAAEAAQSNASSKTSPVRYGREPGDIAACGCPNADTTTAGTPSPQLVAAKQAEAEAAAELAAAKAEARQFLESVKGGTESGGFSAYQPIW